MFTCDHLAATFLKLPDLKDPEAVQEYFLEEIQLGEEHLAGGYSWLLALYRLNCISIKVTCGDSFCSPLCNQVNSRKAWTTWATPSPCVASLSSSSRFFSRRSLRRFSRCCSPNCPSPARWLPHACFCPAMPFAQHPHKTPWLLLVAAGIRKDARWMLEPSKTEGCVSVALSYFTSKTERPTDAVWPDETFVHELDFSAFSCFSEAQQLPVTNRRWRWVILSKGNSGFSHPGGCAVLCQRCARDLNRTSCRCFLLHL